MILKEKTLKDLNISIDAISENSHKKIWVKCDYCGSDYTCALKNRTMSYKNFPKDCCNGCKFKKREEVSLHKYGVKNSAQRKDVKEKLMSFNIHDHLEEIKSLADQGYSLSAICRKLNLPRSSVSRNLERVGAQINFETDRSKAVVLSYIDKHGPDYAIILANNLKKNSLEKYGVENYFQSENIKEKTKKTSLEKYGEEHWSKVENKKKYGNSNVLSKHSVKYKIKKTNNEKYGFDYATQSDFIKNKTKQTNLKKYGTEFPQQNKEILLKRKKTRIEKGLDYDFDGVSIADIVKLTGLSYTTILNNVKRYGFEKTLRMSPKQSCIESITENFLKTLSLEYKKQFRVDRKISDFMINNVIIECDGLYWHSELSLEKFRKVNGKTYHYKKMNLYKNNGYKPLFFRSNEIENKFPIVCSIIKNALRLNSNKIFARKCKVVEISTKEAFDFCESYHLMGGFKSPTHSIGLFYEDTLVSAFQVKQLKKNSGEYDLSRYCTIPDASIIGGFTKMLSFFEKLASPSKLQTFIDMRYGDGDYLQKFGFKEESCYLSFQWTDGIDTFHRMKFKGNSGYENGLFKIWDCGQKKMLKTY